MEERKKERYCILSLFASLYQMSSLKWEQEIRCYYCRRDLEAYKYHQKGVVHVNSILGVL